MLRLVLGLVAGVLVGMATIAAMEMAGQALFPPEPGGLSQTDPGYVASLPVASLLLVIAAFGLGVYLGSAVALRIARRRWAGWAITGLLAAATVANFVLIPHPVWFMAASAAAIALAGIAAQRWPGLGAVDGPRTAEA